jgi:hypothetical protein
MRAQGKTSVLEINAFETVLSDDPHDCFGKGSAVGIGAHSRRKVYRATPSSNSQHGFDTLIYRESGKVKKGKRPTLLWAASTNLGSSALSESASPITLGSGVVFLDEIAQMADHGIVLSVHTHAKAYLTTSYLVQLTLCTPKSLLRHEANHDTAKKWLDEAGQEDEGELGAGLVDVAGGGVVEFGPGVAQAR